MASFVFVFPACDSSEKPASSLILCAREAKNRYMIPNISPAAVQ